MLRRPLRVIDSDGHLIAAVLGGVPETLRGTAALHAGDQIAGSSDPRMPRSGAALELVDASMSQDRAIPPPRQATCASNVKVRSPTPPNSDELISAELARTSPQ